MANLLNNYCDSPAELVEYNQEIKSFNLTDFRRQVYVYGDRNNCGIGAN